MIISFAWTTAAFLARAKTRTRRQWDPDYAARFKAGTVVDAYDKNPRYGGRKIGEIRILEEPVLHDIWDMPDEDFEREGFAWFESHPEDVPRSDPLGIRQYGAREAFVRWRVAGGWYYIIDFEIVFLTDAQDGRV